MQRWKDRLPCSPCIPPCALVPEAVASSFLEVNSITTNFQISFQSISTLLLSLQTVHLLVKNVIIHPGLGQYFWLSIMPELPPVCSEHEVISLFPPCPISFGVKMTDLNFMLFLFL